MTPSLLITDDDLDFRETLKEVFEPRGFRTLTAGDGEEALEIVHRESVHLILLDMHMPRLTGLETILRLRQEQSRLPCILISAALNDGIVEQAKQADVYSVLSKPIRFREITKIVSEAMQTTYEWYGN
ncbi:MAG: CheY-like chemotaxis protein [Pirellulaceae bacterium]|jgi:CheY-like chemotaxis protein